ncbi:MAG TPA: AmmeMemoRadiSam system protein A [Clostridia bacterium]
MGKIISSYVFPHPPVLVPDVGKGNEKLAKATVNAAMKAAASIATEKPDTIIITTPHGPVFSDYIYISQDSSLYGNFKNFGSSCELEFSNDTELVKNIVELSAKEGIPAGGLDDYTLRRFKADKKLDHGALVPLYFVSHEIKGVKIVHISTAFLSFEELYRFGMCIKEAVEKSQKRVVFIASGDLSHRLSDESHYGYNEKGPVFDKMIVESFKTVDVEKLFTMDEGFCEEAGECGLRSFLMMFGAFEGVGLNSEVLSYEGPFGIGYSVARFEAGEADPERKIYDAIMEKKKKRMQEIKDNEDNYVALARKSLESYILNGRMIEIPDGLSQEMLERRAGTFVSLKINGQLRGCIGTIAPTTDSIACEIVRNAVSAGTEDPRFDPVEKDELGEIVYSVDVLDAPEPIESMEQLDVLRYGVIVESGGRRGLLLPNLEGIRTPKEQVSEALRKAGIRKGEKYSMERFEVVRHH